MSASESVEVGGEAVVRSQWAAEARAADALVQRICVGAGAGDAVGGDCGDGDDDGAL